MTANRVALVIALPLLLLLIAGACFAYYRWGPRTFHSNDGSHAWISSASSEPSFGEGALLDLPLEQASDLDGVLDSNEYVLMSEANGELTYLVRGVLMKGHPTRVYAYQMSGTLVVKTTYLATPAVVETVRQPMLVTTTRPVESVVVVFETIE